MALLHHLNAFYHLNGTDWGIIQSLYLSGRERDKEKEGERESFSVERLLLFVILLSTIFTLPLSFTAIDLHEESVEDLMQRFQDSFRAPDTPTEISHYEHVMHSSLTGRRRVPTHTRGEPVPVCCV